jgi:aspartyl-tRNA(Asn)/glutamyl-tRNA(Gln) amidotransferase subunit A
MERTDMHDGNETPNRSVDRVARCLAAIDAWNPHVNAMVTTDAEGARQAARDADAQTAAGRSRGLLHGVPVIVKDNLDTAGLRTTYGSGFFADHVPTQDAHVVARLRQAGAVIVGKATMHEFAYGVRSFNPVIGQCRNPWNTTRIPGGSSGGSGVAVATGMGEMALGTDTGGSVRIPAALNGITGLRPTFGRVSNHGCMPVSPTHDTVGPMARTVEEVARLFAVIAGFDRKDPLSEARPVDQCLARLSDGIEGLRIGRPTNHYFTGLDPDVADALDGAIDTLRGLGARIVELEVPGAESIHAFATTMIASDAHALHAGRIEQGGNRWAAQTLERIRLAARFSGVDYARAMRERERWCRMLEGLFEEVDMLVSPTSATVAPPIDDERSLFEATRAVTQNTYAGAFGRLPGLSLPCGLSQAGLPIGLQLEAAPWNDALLLQAGWAFQSVTDWHQRRPTPPRTA